MSKELRRTKAFEVEKSVPIYIFLLVIFLNSNLTIVLTKYDKIKLIKFIFDLIKSTKIKKMDVLLGLAWVFSHNHRIWCVNFYTKYLYLLNYCILFYVVISIHALMLQCVNTLIIIFQTFFYVSPSCLLGRSSQVLPYSFFLSFPLPSPLRTCTHTHIYIYKQPLSLSPSIL